LLSALAFTAFFLVYTVSACFWGRLVLKACGVRSGLPYGSPLPLCAFLGVLALVLRHVSLFAWGFETIYTAVFLLGAFGALAEGTLYVLKRRRERSLALKAGAGETAARTGDGAGETAAWTGDGGGEKSAERVPTVGAETAEDDAIPDLLDGPWPLASALLCAFGFGLYFCLISPTGRPDPWLSNAIDYYSWIFAADYWRGAVDPARYSIADPGAWFIDAFGQNVHMGLFSTALGGFSMASGPLYSATLMAWTTSALSIVVRGAFGLPRPLCILAGAGVCGGPLYNYLVINGAFGHMFAIFLTAAGLCAVLFPGRDRKPLARFARVLFPVMSLFMGYQAGFPVFWCLLAGVSFLPILMEAVEVREAALKLKAERERQEEFARGSRIFRRGQGTKDASHIAPDPPLPKVEAVDVIVKRCLKAALWPLALAVAVSAVLSPQTLFWTVGRIGSSLSQVSGVRLGLLDPHLFSGYPFVSMSLLTDCRRLLGYDDHDWVPAICFFVMVWSLCEAFASTPTGTEGHREGWGIPARRFAMTALCSMLVLSVFGYLAVYIAKGDSYQLWKAAGMTALPLSFAFPALMFSWIKFLLNTSLKRASLAIMVTIAMYLAGVIWVAGPMPGHSGRPLRPWPMLPLISEVYRAHQEGQGQERAVFDLASASRNMAALALSSGAPERELKALKGAYFIPDNEDYLPLVGPGTVFYTDHDCRGAYGSCFTPPSAAFRLYRWDTADFVEKGAMSWTGVYRFTGDLVAPEASVTVVPPLALRGRDAELEVTVNMPVGAGDPSCRMVIAVADGIAGPPLETDVSDIVIPLPAEAFKGGAARVRMLFQGFVARGPEDGSFEDYQFWKKYSPGTLSEMLLCDYAIQNAVIRAAGVVPGRLEKDKDGSGNGNGNGNGDENSNVDVDVDVDVDRDCNGDGESGNGSGGQGK
jgi:hypothetical protein